MTFRIQLEDASGSILLEDASGYIVLEDFVPEGRARARGARPFHLDHMDQVTEMNALMQQADDEAALLLVLGA